MAANGTLAHLTRATNSMGRLLFLHQPILFGRVGQAREDDPPPVCFDAAKTKPAHMPGRIAYQGSPGAFAHIAAESAYPQAQSCGYRNLADVVAAVLNGEADAVVLPCENILAGRVPDIHLLIPESGLFIIGEIFQPIALHLAAVKGAKLGNIRRVYSHPIALQQVRRFLEDHDLEPVAESNTATAAAALHERNDPQEAAIASELAAKVYELEILHRNVEDNPHNMTRFYVLAAKPIQPARQEKDVITSLLFDVNNHPGALIGALGGFAEHGVNLSKLESYLVDGQFVATRFFCEFEGHPERDGPRRALDTLKQRTKRHSILGVYPMHVLGAGARAGLFAKKKGGQP